MQHARSERRSRLVPAAPAGIAAALFLVLVLPWWQGRAMVALTAGLVVVCLAVCVAVAVWQERTGRDNVERAEQFARSQRLTNARRPPEPRP
jgi:hypothetical protein